MGLTDQWQYLVPIFSTCCSKQLYRSVLLRCSSASSSPKKRQSSCSGVSWGQLTWQETGRRSKQDPFFGRKAEHENATGRMDLGLAAQICNLFTLSLVVSLPCLLVFKKLYREELLPLEQQALSPASTAVPSFVISSMETSAQAECPELLDGSVRLWRVLHRSDTEVPRVFVTQTLTGCTGGTCCTHSPAAPAGYSYTRKFLLYFQ